MIAARRRVEVQDTDRRTRLVDWAQVAAVGLAGIGLVLNGYSGLLQHQATRDQLKQSEEAREREKEELASLFEVRLGNSGTKSSGVVMSNYGRHSVHFATVLLETPDGKRWVVQATSVAPCTTKLMTFESIQKLNSEFSTEYDGNIEDGWENAIRTKGIFFHDYEGQAWAPIPLRDIPSETIDEIIDAGDYKWVTIDGGAMDGISKDSPLKTC
ncbi:hypothetical protein [Streptomyces rubrogriseus]|uniref:Uncharacterized protein n=1 Tax=Streptomyces rubrogriseus TaxID=194673 RepID=A0A6G3TEQ5_9ACTN|nr:hypothetical protein [Streptomyces rubrogriseus]NEC35114.1 hypothetical protein [Streptomyces rubrogriseus]